MGQNGSADQPHVDREPPQAAAAHEIDERRDRDQPARLVLREQPEMEGPDGKGYQRPRREGDRHHIAASRTMQTVALNCRPLNANGSD